jgi:hypothetical protein
VGGEGRSMKSASRTLVKSPPELWQLIDQPGRMQGLMCALLGHATEVTVYERKPESVLGWQAAGDGDDAKIEVELAEKGWGTHVEVSVEGQTEPTRLEGWLDAVLEELATPQKRPFEGMDKPPEPIADLEELPAEPAAEEPPPAEPRPADPPPAKKKRRRFFGF